MNIYSLIPIVAFFFNGFVCTFIFAQKKDSPINRAFLFSVSLPAFYSLYLIFMAMRVAKDFNMKHSLPLLFTGSLLTLLIGITSNIIIPLFFGLKHFVEF